MMSKVLTRSAIPFLAVTLMVGGWTVGAAAVVSPSIQFVQADFHLDQQPGGTAAQCNLDLGTFTVNATTHDVSIGLSNDTSSPGGPIPLAGLVKLTVTQNAKLDLTGATKTPAVATGKFLMTYAGDPKHRLVGTFNAVAE